MRINGPAEILAGVLFVKSGPLPLGMRSRHCFARDCAACFFGFSTTGRAFDFQWVQHHPILRLTGTETEPDAATRGHIKKRREPRKRYRIFCKDLLSIPKMERLGCEGASRC